jgi:outer membrane protein OmpA-like peptidoglycan-associated protein/outer membrane protein W
MSLKKVLLAATVLALPVAAQAQPVNGLYIAGGAGANYRFPSTSDAGLKMKTQIGAVGLASIGWGFGNGLRAELEGNFRQNDITRSSVRTGVISRNTGYLQSYGPMVNVLYDINLGAAVTPYVGAGVGYGFNKVQTRGVSGTTSYYVNNAEGAVAYQGILGVAYSLSSMVPGLSLTAEARYYGTLEPSIHAESRTSGVLTRSTVKPSNDNVSGLIGFRYAFGAPASMAPAAAPAPAPAAAPGVARTYLVFFDWDRADLTARAREIIKEAATNAQRANVTRIEVAGHADRSGDAAYNQRLSQRRAEAVAAQLVRDGVARGAISVQAFGESRPLVPTADNVREPQNRRVEIVLR